MERSAVSRRRWLLVLALFIPIVADIGANLFSRSQFWPAFLPSLYYAGIVIAGLEFGWKAGLGAALLGAISHSLITEQLSRSPFTQVKAHLLAFLIVGFALVEERREARDRRNHVGDRLPEHPGEPIRPEECVEQVSALASELLRQVRTPFASIEGAAFILGENSTTPDKRCEFLGIIMNACKRVDAILSELDACTEIIPLACRPTDASSMLGEVIRLAAMEHPDPAISLRIEVAPDLPQMWCDPIRIQQTMVPFVTGVMLGMPGGGEILLAANRQNGHARIQLKVLGQTVRSSDPAEGRGAYSSTFDAPGGVRILAARRTVLQHGGTITLDQTGTLKKMVSLTLPLYLGQQP
jgi:signal transduction histidine kinase